MREEKKVTKTKIILFIIYILGIIGYAFLFYKYAVFCQYVHNQYETIKNGVTAEAELVSYEYVGSENDGRGPRYNVWYEYTDGDIKYKGVGLYNVSLRNAQKSIGEKIEIYIDGKGLSIAVGVYPSTFEAVLDSIGMAVLFVLVFSWFFAGEKILDFFHKLGEKFDDKRDNEPLSSQLKK